MLPEKLVRARETGTIEFRIPAGLVSANWKDCDAQRVGIAHLLLQPRMLLADPTGTGKTPTTAIAYGVVKRMKGWKGLILTPQSNLTPWKEKVEFFLNGVTAEVYHSEGRESVLDQSPDLLITTYQTACRDIDILLKYFKGCPKVAVLDEAHWLRGWGQEKLRPTIARLTQHSTYVWAATATPDTGQYRDLAALMEFLVPGLIGTEEDFDTNFTKRVKITLPKTAKNPRKRVFYRKATKPQHFRNIPQLLKRVEPFFLRRPFSAFGSAIPSVDWREVWVDMNPDHAKLYHTVLNKILPATPDREERLLADIAAHTYAQMVSDAPGVLGFDEHPAKFDSLTRLLESELSQEHVVIYAKYAQVATWLQNRLRARYTTREPWHVTVVGTITGADGKAARDQARSRFQRENDPIGGLGGTTCLIVTNAGAESLDLQRARAVVLYDLPWTTAELTQVVGRARRIGSPHASVLVYALGQNNLSDRADAMRIRTRSRITTNIINTLTTNTTTRTGLGVALDPTRTTSSDVSPTNDSSSDVVVESTCKIANADSDSCFDLFPPSFIEEVQSTSIRNKGTLSFKRDGSAARACQSVDSGEGGK